jgi:hypothetical protein
VEQKFHKHTSIEGMCMCECMYVCMYVCMNVCIILHIFAAKKWDKKLIFVGVVKFGGTNLWLTAIAMLSWEATSAFRMSRMKWSFSAWAQMCSKVSPRLLGRCKETASDRFSLRSATSIFYLYIPTYVGIWCNDSVTANFATYVHLFIPMYSSRCPSLL